MTPADPVVLHVITRYLSGGSEQRVRDIVHALPQARHVICTGVAVDHHAPAGVTIDREPMLRRELSPWHDARALVRLVRRVRRDRPQVIVTHQSKAGLLGRIAGRLVGVPVVHSLSMASFGDGYGRVASAVFRTAERLLVGSTAAYVVVGRDLADQFRAIGVPEDRLSVVRSSPALPRPPSDHQRARRQLLDQAGVAGDPPVLVYVGSLDDRKNVLELPRLLDEVDRVWPGPPPVLIAAGDGPRRDELQRLGAGRVHLLGHVADPTSVFHGADVVVLLSRVEGLPQVLVQAASSGAPFVAYRVSGADELVHLGARGDVVPWGNVGAAARAVATHLGSPVERHCLADLREWDPQVVRGRYRAILSPLLGDAASIDGGPWAPAAPDEAADAAATV
jgi:glycosyltransferase involved in cell wall biosynthesis